MKKISDLTIKTNGMKKVKLKHPDLYAMLLEEDYEVETGNACISGKAGNYIVTDSNGDIYSVTSEDFAKIYEDF